MVMSKMFNIFLFFLKQIKYQFKDNYKGSLNRLISIIWEFSQFYVSFVIITVSLKIWVNFYNNTGVWIIILVVCFN